MTAPVSGFGAAVLGLLLVLAGVPVYVLTIDAPWLRSSGVAAFAPMAGGVILAGWAAGRERRRRVALTAAACVALTALWSWVFLWWAELPRPAAPIAAVAADFTLTDHTGRPVQLAERAASGPLLLVFYRGHW